MAAAERRELVPATSRPLTLQQERELAALVDRYFAGPDEQGVDLGVALARWAFERGDVGYLPGLEQLRRDGVVFVPVTPWGDVKPVWIAQRAAVSATAQAVAPAPTLRELGAEPIDGGRRA